eukprot:GHVR01164488.1.p3 GENE.GHVR01164488.1~~GHVR01164488.1.p3  ORF type:complete len:105 (+),score=26.38 GHVR01164488.1:2-316(+)
MLMQPVSRLSEWILRTAVCAHLFEQLLMLELYGGCSTNIQELYVPDDVYKGLDRMVNQKHKLSDVSGPATSEPLALYLKAPSAFKKEAHRWLVPEAEREKLNAG